MTGRSALGSFLLDRIHPAGRVDLRCDAAGQPNFMEVNPLAGLHPQHSDLPILAAKVGMPYVELIGRIVESAAPRVEESKRSKARRFKI